MSIGQLKRIQLVRVVSTKNANGTNQNTKTLYTYWAEVVQGSASRTYQNSQTQLGTSYQFRIRYNSSLNIDSSYSIVYEGKQFTITGAVRENNKNFYWLISAEAKHP